MARISTNVDSLMAFQKLSANTSRPGRPGSSRESESGTRSKGRTDEVSSKQEPEGLGPRASFGQDAAGLEYGRSLVDVDPTATVNANRATEMAAATRIDLLEVESGGGASMAGANPANAIDLMLE